MVDRRPASLSCGSVSFSRWTPLVNLRSFSEKFIPSDRASPRSPISPQVTHLAIGRRASAEKRKAGEEHRGNDQPQDQPLRVRRASAAGVKIAAELAIDELVVVEILFFAPRLGFLGTLPPVIGPTVALTSPTRWTCESPWRHIGAAVRADASVNAAASLAICTALGPRAAAGEPATNGWQGSFPAKQRALFGAGERSTVVRACERGGRSRA